jgi:hypothetical protein
MKDIPRRISNRAGSLPQPPSLPANFKPPVALAPAELLDRIHLDNIELPANIIEKIEEAQRTVHLSARRPFVERAQGPMYLIYIDPYWVDSLANIVFYSGDHGPPITNRNFEEPLRLILPSGKLMLVDFSVQSEEAETFFHVKTYRQGTVAETITESTGQGQHLVFALDARENGIYGFDVQNQKREDPDSLGRPWTFFGCTIVELD